MKKTIDADCNTLFLNNSSGVIKKYVKYPPVAKKGNANLAS
jgi:hypothetical protein